MDEPAIDPFQVEVFKCRLDSIANQMAITTLRTAYSAILRDSIDFSTAVTDANGLTLAQGVTCPVHLGSFPAAMNRLIEMFGAQLHEGDVFAFNDPYVAAGQHLPDIYVVKPIFWKANLIAFGITVGHHSDVGGIVPGSNSIGSIEIFQEGLRLPIVKLIDAGRPVDAIWEILRLNVRTPDEVVGDLHAQIGACNICEREMVLLYEAYGADMVRLYSDYLQRQGEEIARASIAGLPDGIYRFEDHIDGLGERPEPITLHVAVTIDGDRATVDWTGSSPTVAGGLNSPKAYTHACCYAAFRCLMPPNTPNCHGFTRPITVVVPEDCFLNARFPAACGVKGLTGYRMIDCLFGALAQALPQQLTADGAGGATLCTISGSHEGRRFVFSETVAGNYGGSAQHDGEEGVAHIGANHTNIPIELIEQRYPLRITQYGLGVDTAGAGRYRGGAALFREYEILADSALLQVRSDKRDFPPHGLFGGREGSASWNILNPGTPDERILPALMTEPMILRKGDVFRHVMSGGGGYGPPELRAEEDILTDIHNGLLSVDAAGKQYGWRDAPTAAPARLIET